MKSKNVWVWGTHSVLEALRAGRTTTLIVDKQLKMSPRLSEALHLAQTAGVDVQSAPLSDLHRMAGDEHVQGMIALISLPDSLDFTELLAQAHGSTRPPLFLALEQVQDPHNLGALLRTASVTGVDAVLLLDRHSASVSGTVARTSAGAVFHVPISVVGNLARALEQASAAGLWVVGLDQDGTQLLYDTDLRVPLVLVVGSEGEGLRRLTRARCDLVLRLPMEGGISSLNASVAGSIAMYEVVRQQRRTT